MGFFSDLSVLYNAARGIIPFGRSTTTDLPVPISISADGVKADVTIGDAGDVATEATLVAVGATATAIAADVAATSAKATSIYAAVDELEASVAGLLGGTESSYGILRTWSGTTADTEPPADASFVTISHLGAVEIKLAATAVGGTVSPTQVRFRVWGRIGTGSTTVKLDEFIVNSATLILPDATNPLLTKRYNCQCNQVYLTCTFLDGKAPTITGFAYVRAVAQSSRDDSVIRKDPSTGNPVVQTLAYDALTGSDKVTVMGEVNPALSEALVVSATSLALGTAYWPSADGIEMGTGYDSLAMLLTVVGAGASVATVTVESTIGSSAWTTPIDITQCVVDDKTGSTLAGAVVSAPGGNITESWTIYGCNKDRVRVKVVVTGIATGAVSAGFRRARLGGES